MNSANIIMQ